MIESTQTTALIAPGSAQKMTGHGLGGVHDDVIGMLTEDFFDRLGLILIIETGGRCHVH